MIVTRMFRLLWGWWSANPIPRTPTFICRLTVVSSHPVFTINQVDRDIIPITYEYDYTNQMYRKWFYSSELFCEDVT